MDTFHPQRMEEAFRTGIVVTTALILPADYGVSVSSGNPLNSTDRLCLVRDDIFGHFTPPQRHL